jgi:hypothetical protein
MFDSLGKITTTFIKQIQDNHYIFEIRQARLTLLKDIALSGGFQKSNFFSLTFIYFTYIQSFATKQKYLHMQFNYI